MVFLFVLLFCLNTWRYSAACSNVFGRNNGSRKRRRARNALHCELFKEINRTNNIRFVFKMSLKYNPCFIVVICIWQDRWLRCKKAYTVAYSSLFIVGQIFWPTGIQTIDTFKAQNRVSSRFTEGLTSTQMITYV